MLIRLERKDLINSQQLEVAVNGPDGATHLILCTGVVELDPLPHGTYTFFVGPHLSRRQYVGVIASGALSSIQGAEEGLQANLVLIDAFYDEMCSQVRVRTEVSSSIAMTKLAISYQVSILAELPGF